MPFVNREAPHEPDAPPTALGRHIWQVAHDHPGEWRVVYEDTHRSKVVMLEGCLVGRGQGRISPILDLTGWEARCVERPDDDGDPIYELRVRFTPAKVREDKAAAAKERAEAVKPDDHATEQPELLEKPEARR